MKKRITYLFLFFAFSVIAINSQGQAIRIVAGTRIGGFYGDGGLADTARLSTPCGMRQDKYGNIYIADASNRRVRKIAAGTGIISTFAGNGISLYSGDGGQATAAGFKQPVAIAIDDSGNVFISDDVAMVVRKVEASSGIITTVAGYGAYGYSGNGGPATAAKLYYPMGIALDKKGNLYIADQANSVIRKVTASTGIITSIAGNGFPGGGGDGGPAISAYLDGPADVAIDDTGNIYIADRQNSRVRKVDTNGIISTYAGGGHGLGDGGPATAATVGNPNSLAFDKAGNLYIIDQYHNTLRRVDGSTQIITTVAGGGTSLKNRILADSAQLLQPVATMVDTLGNPYLSQAAYADIICELYTPVTPIAGFRIKDTIACGGVIAFEDTSTNYPATWKWTFTGGIPDTSSLQNPKIYYSSSGIYTVKLVVSDLAGSDSITKTINITVKPKPVITLTGNTKLCKGMADTIITSGGAGYAWSTGSTSDTIIVVPAATTTYSVAVINAVGCARDTSMKVAVDPLPVITFAGDTVICSGRSTLLGVGGASSYSWVPTTGLSAANISNPFASPSSTTTYTVTGTDNSGCSGSYLVTIDVYPSNGFDLTGALTVCIDTPTFKGAIIQACIYNNRCLPTNGTLKLILDTAIRITSTISDSVAKVNGDTLIWHYDSLTDISATHCVLLNGTVDSLHSGDSVFVTMIITPAAGDSVPSNNAVTYWVKPFPYNCVGLPFDPNEKSVYPIGDISAAQKLKYTIHFQNTGTAVAHNVVVADTLSPYLDVTTLQVTSSSSPVITSIVSGNIIKFTFDNINLPDTAMSKTSSIGVVQYEIYPLNTDTKGEQIKNSAGIYFDANPVVVTNETVNTINDTPLSMQDVTAGLHIGCFPNPFHTSTNIIFNANDKHYLELFDLTGRKLRTIECDGKLYQLNRGELEQGVYFIKVYDAEREYTLTDKIVVQ